MNQIVHHWLLRAIMFSLAAGAPGLSPSIRITGGIRSAELAQQGSTRQCGSGGGNERCIILSHQRSHLAKHLTNLQEGGASQPALCGWEALVAWGVRVAGVMGTPGSGARQGWEAAQGLSGGLCMSLWVLCHLMSPWVLCHLTCMHPSHRETLFICIRCSFHLVGNCSQHTKYVKKGSFLCCLNTADSSSCFSGFQLLDFFPFLN